MDLSSITASANTVEIRHPATSEPIGLTINLRPPTHPDVKAVNRKLMNETLKARGGKLTAEKLEANSMDRLVAATESFAWGAGADGEPASWNGEKLEATHANVRNVYTKAPWIKQQVDEALGDEASFFRGAD
jgi:hypothetical protein